MADPATQFGQAGLNAPYQYTPVETRLNPPIHLDPVNYDAITKAVSSIPGLLMQSPLNPAVRGQMQAERDRYNLERNVISDVDKLSPSERMRRVSVGQEGAQIVPGYQTGNIGTPPSTAPPSTAPGNANQPNQPTVRGPIANQPNQPANPPDANQPANQPDQSGQFNEKGPLMPAGGDLPQRPSALQFGDPFASPTKANPPAAPDQTVQAQTPDQYLASKTRLPSQGGDIGSMSASTDNQQLLTQWQNQNAHPVMSSQDALSWAKNFDTGAQRATYLPKGGPGGQPAYAFHMKGGGINTVPVSQMAQNGAGPLIAGQNTSQVLNASDRIDQSQQPQGQPPAAPGDQGQGPIAATGPLAPTDQQGQQQQFTPEQQQYLASRAALPSQGGDISTMAADTTNDFLLKKNTAINTALGDTALAPGTIRDNPSNVPRSIIPTHTDPIPPGEVPGQQDQAIQAKLAAAKQRGLSTLPNGNDPDNNGQRLLETTDRGISWYVDSDPDPNNPDSHLPYLVLNTTPWSEMRMYNTEGTTWHTQEVVRHDRLLDKQIYDNLLQDSTGWKTPDGKPDQARKINALRDNYLTHTTIPMDSETGAKLSSTRSQVLQSQRIQNAVQHMSPDDWGWIRGIQNDVAKNANQLAGLPFADAFMKEVAKKVAPGGVDPRRQYLADAYASLMKGREDPALSPEERGELDNIGLDEDLPRAIGLLNKSRMQEFNRYTNQALANKMRVSDDYVDTARSITASRKIPDAAMPDWATMPNPRGSPTASPTPAPIGDQTNPYKVNWKDYTDYNNLPMNSWYVGPDNRMRQKLPPPAQNQNQPTPAPAPRALPVNPQPQVRRALPVNP